MKIYFLFLFTVVLFVYSGCRENATTSTDENSQPDAQVTEAGEFISPAAGDVWDRGSTYTIRWKEFAPEYNVDMILLKKKKYYPVVMLTNASNLGTFTWKVPDDIVPSTYYQLKLINSSSPDHYIYSSPFVIR